MLMAPRYPSAAFRTDAASVFRHINTTFTVLDTAAALRSAGKGRAHPKRKICHYLLANMSLKTCVMMFFLWKHIRRILESSHTDIFHLLTSTKLLKK